MMCPSVCPSNIVSLDVARAKKEERERKDALDDSVNRGEIFVAELEALMLEYGVLAIATEDRAHAAYINKENRLRMLDMFLFMDVGEDMYNALKEAEDEAVRHDSGHPPEQEE